MARTPEPGPGGVTRSDAVALMAQRGIGYKAATSFYADVHQLSDVDATRLQRKLKRWAAWGRDKGHLQKVGASTGASFNLSKTTRPAPAAVPDEPPRSTRPSSRPEEVGEPVKPPPPPAPPLVDVTGLDRVEMARWMLRQWIWAVDDARYRNHSGAVHRALREVQSAKRELADAEAEAEAASPTFSDDMDADEMREALTGMAGRLQIQDLEVFVAEYQRRTQVQLVGGEPWF